VTHQSRFLSILLLATIACRATQPTSTSTREDAYRANNRGVAALEQFQFDPAIAAFRQALELDPTLKLAHINLPIALFYGGKNQEAAVAATAARQRYSDAPQPIYLLGMIARVENRPDEAIDAFRGVLKLDPDDVGAKVNLALLHVQRQEYNEATSLAEQALAVEPYNATAAYNLGLARSRGGDREAGLQAMQRFQTLRTTAYAVTYSQTYLEEGRYAQAVATTGGEAELVDRSPSPARFSVASVPAASSAPSPPSSFGRTFTASDLNGDNVRQFAASLGGGLTPIDLDGDGGAPDLFVAAAPDQVLLRNNGQSTWTDVTAAAAFGAVPRAALPIGAITGDVDNDERPDLFVLRDGGNSLYRNEGGGRFTDVTSRAKLPPYPHLPGAAAFVDVDHDGDLDLLIAGLADIAATRAAGKGPFVFPRDFAGAPLQLLRNNGNGTFSDIATEARLQGRFHAIAIVPTDFDNRRDIDLLIVNRDSPPVLYRNMRDGTFRDVAGEVGLAGLVGPGDEAGAVAAADVNKDDFPDLFISRASGGVFAMSDGRGRFTTMPAPGGTAGATAAQFVDYDNDGLLDLLTWSSAGPRIFRSTGQLSGSQRGGGAGVERWSDVTSSAIAISPTIGAAPQAGPMSSRGLALADLDADGDTDIATIASNLQPIVWTNSGDSRHRSVRVRLKGRVSNRLGAGSKVQVRAGSLSQRLESSAATPAIAPADIVFGLGSRAGADVVRVLWPSGVLQAETAASGKDTATSLTIEELDRKPSSCPFLFTWNGERFEFVTDFLGGGEMGYWEGPGRYNHPDPVEYVRVRGDQLRPKDGRYEIRVTNELEETLFVDRLQLVAITHPEGLDVFPNEGMTTPPKASRLFAVRDARVPTRVVDEHGHDVTARIAKLDRQYPDDFDLLPIRGYAKPHALTIDLGAPRIPHPAPSTQHLAPGTHPAPRTPHPAPVLLMPAWTDYAFSSDNVAAHQAGLMLAPPSLQIQSASGAWRTAIPDIGIPVGRPQTIVVDLAPHLRAGERDVRVLTNMRIYWDQILVGESVDPGVVKEQPLDPTAATLRSRGFSAEVRPDGRAPTIYDYGRVSLRSPWKVLAGSYTREGDVRELVATSDDMFVVAKPGDEIALSFEAAAVGSLADGWARTFLLVGDGFSKEMDIHSASPDTVEPLPFQRMTRYPYAAPERYPDTPEHRRYRQQYNTRVVVRPVPSIDQSR
jgi:lipoprotein NlpI